MSAIQSPYSAGLTKVAATPVAGVALVNGTPSILTWTPPNDGQLHRVLIFLQMDVTSNTTGGRVDCLFTMPDGVTGDVTISNQQAGTGYNYNNYLANFPVLVQGGAAVQIVQATALTGGAATMWAEIWGS